MSYGSPYSPTKGTTSSTTVKKRTLNDSSWIKKGDDSFDTEDDSQPMLKTGSVSNLTKRFGGSQDLDKSNTSPTKTTVKSPRSSVKTSSSSTTTTTIKTETKTTTPSKPPTPTKPATSPVKTSFTDRVFNTNKTTTQKYSSPTKTTTVTTTTTKDTPDGKTTTVITTSKETNGVKTSSPASPVNIKTSVESTPKSPVPTTRSSFKTTTIVQESPSPTWTETKSTSYKTNTLDNLADTLIDVPTKTSDSTTIKTSYSTRKSSYDSPKNTDVESISGSNLDKLADTLDPFSSSIPPPPPMKAPTSPLDSWSDSRKSSTITVRESYESPSPTYSKSTRYSSSSSSGDQFISSSSSPSLQSLSKRSLSDRNLCSFCNQSIADTTRMVLEELHIHSHATCFKCSVCHRKLGNLIAGDSLWVYRDDINCDDCYQKTRDRWFH